jgi:hypothetical protein
MPNLELGLSEKRGRPGVGERGQGWGDLNPGVGDELGAREPADLFIRLLVVIGGM